MTAWGVTIITWCENWTDTSPINVFGFPSLSTAESATSNEFTVISIKSNAEVITCNVESLITLQQNVQMRLINILWPAYDICVIENMDTVPIPGHQSQEHVGRHGHILSVSVPSKTPVDTICMFLYESPFQEGIIAYTMYMFIMLKITSVVQKDAFCPV
jgi:hypothetical protein